jgi:hypothetical protein
VQLHGFAIADEMSAYDAKGLHAMAGKFQSSPVKQLRWLHAIPNGGARDPVTAARMKAEGVKAGVPDLFLPIARYETKRGAEPWHGLYIEMKKGKDGRQSKEQMEFEDHCFMHAYQYVVCRNWREAADHIKNYLT